MLRPSSSTNINRTECCTAELQILHTIPPKIVTYELFIQLIKQALHKYNNITYYFYIQ